MDFHIHFLHRELENMRFKEHLGRDQAAKPAEEQKKRRHYGTLDKGGKQK
jgi:hypothetical protein